MRSSRLRPTGTNGGREVDASTVRDAWVILRTEQRTTIRRLLASPRQAAATGIWILFFGIGFPVLLAGAVRPFARSIAAGSPPIGVIGAVVGSLLVGGFYLGFLVALRGSDAGTVAPLIRTSTTPEAVTLGTMGNEVSSVLLYFVTPALLGFAVEIGVEAGSPLAPVLVIVVAALPLLTGFLVGRIAGAILQYVGVFAGIGEWPRRLIRLVAAAAIYVGFRVFLPGSSGGPSLSVPAFLPGRPLQAYAGVVFAPAGSTLTPTGIGAVIATLAVIGVGFEGAIRIETALLFREEAQAASRAETTTRARRAPWWLGGAASTRMAYRYLLRTRRDPGMIAHLFPLSFGLVGIVLSVLTNPASARLLVGPAFVVAGVVIAGEAYGLNPLGDDGDQLPLIMTSVPSTAVLLRGRAIAGGLPGFVIAAIGVGLSALDGSAAIVALHALLAIVLIPSAAGAALGLGAIAPRFDRREYMNVERAHPSTGASVGFLLGASIVAGIGFVLRWWSFSGVPITYAIGAWVVYLAIVIGAGVGGYGYAVKVFDGLSMDDV